MSASVVRIPTEAIVKSLHVRKALYMIMCVYAKVSVKNSTPRTGVMYEAVRDSPQALEANVWNVYSDGFLLPFQIIIS